jgi:alpha-D-ribose 1-methylphosphonate 5-triphosphate synthase subunit PhnH
VSKPFDAVHDLQAVFRALLDAFSFPGKVVSLAPQAARLSPLATDVDNPALAAAALTLIDSESPYFVDATDPLARFLVEWSAVRPGALAEAAYVVQPRFDDGLLAGLIEMARLGTLVDPHLGATLLIGVESLIEGQTLRLRGPGIANSVSAVLPYGPRWLAARNQKVAEFPLGIDLAFFDRDHRVVALPRATRLTREGS